MRKLALGLNSIPSGNVPGSENVEVPNLNEEDIESANKTGFNAIEQSGFDKEEGLDKAIIAYNKIFNYRLGKKMRDELIKLNKALNGIGYKNLIKIAKPYKPNISPNDFKEGKMYTRLDLSNVPEFSFIVIGHDITGNIDAEIYNKGKSNYSSGDHIQINSSSIKSYVEGDKFTEERMIPPESESQSESGYPDYSESGYSDDESALPAASTAPVVNKNSVSSAGVKAIPIEPPGSDTINNYIGKTYKSENKNDNWHYKIIGQFEVEVSKDNSNFKKLTPKTMGVSKWNTFAKAIINYMSNNQLEEITPTVSAETPAEPVAPAATSTPPAVAPTTTEAAQPATGGSVSETVNGKPAVSIGTFGKDQIFLIIDSVKKGNPEFYIKDGDTGKASPLGKDDGRVRSSLGPLEINRLSKRLLSAGVSPTNVEGFKELMNLQRRQNRIPFFRRRRDQKMNDASGKMKASTREDRLDSLKKKGVI